MSMWSTPRRDRLCAREFFVAAGLASNPRNAPSGPRSAPNFTLRSALSRRPCSALPTSSSFFPIAVEVAGVDDVHASLERRVDRRDALGFVARPYQLPAPMPMQPRANGEHLGPALAQRRLVRLGHARNRRSWRRFNPMNRMHESHAQRLWPRPGPQPPARVRRRRRERQRHRGGEPPLPHAAGRERGAASAERRRSARRSSCAAAAASC